MIIRINERRDYKSRWYDVACLISGIILTAIGLFGNVSATITGLSLLAITLLTDFEIEVKK